MNKEQLIETLFNRIDEQYGELISDEDEQDDVFFEFFDILDEVEQVESKIVDEQLWYNVRHAIYKFEEDKLIVYFFVVRFDGKNRKLPVPNSVKESTANIKVVHPKLVQVTQYIVEGDNE